MRGGKAKGAEGGERRERERDDYIVYLLGN
jgi:hypothetical protein